MSDGWKRLYIVNNISLPFTLDWKTASCETVSRGSAEYNEFVREAKYDLTNALVNSKLIKYGP